MLATGLLLAALSIALVAYVLSGAVAERRAVYRSLRTMRAVEVSPTDVRRRQLAAPMSSRVVVPAMQRLGRAGRRFTPASVVERLEQELVYAGSPVGWDGERLLAVKVLATVSFAVLGLVLPGLIGAGAVRGLILAPLLGFVGYYLPEWVVRSRAGARQLAIQRALPDALDLLAITVSAGLGFDAAMERVAREMGGPLGEELLRVVQEMRLGKGRADALRDLGERSNVDELHSFVLAMVQAEIFGISISRVLNVQADELRVKRRQRAELEAQKLPVKIVFPLILCIFPALFVVLLGPAAMQVYDSIIAP